MRRLPVELVVVVAMLTTSVVIAEAVHSSAATPAPMTIEPTKTPVESSRLVCPDFAGRTVGQITRTGRIGVGLPQGGPGVTSTANSGTVTMTRLSQLRSAKAKPTTVLTSRGTAKLIEGRGYEGDIVIDASGAFAPGLSADLLDRRDGGVFRGINGVSCVPPAGEAWLLGASTVVGAHSELRLTNTDDVPALIDVTLFGTKGPVTAPGVLGLAVAPRSTKVVALERVAPEERLLLVHVQTRAGRVATALRMQVQSAATPQGVDWLPQAAAPSKLALVPGVISGSGSRRLVLGNPGDNDVSAEVHVVTGTREFVPRGLSAITVPAGQVVAVDLAPALDTKVGSVYVKTDRPIVAAASMATGSRVNGFAEFAWTAAVPALTDPATVVVNYVRARSSLLLFTAPEEAADLRVTTLPGVGPATPRSIDVHVPAGRTVQVDLDRYSSTNVVVGVTVEVVAGSGSVYGAREEIEQGSRSPLYSVLPLRSAPQVRLVKPAVADLNAGLPH